MEKLHKSVMVPEVIEYISVSPSGVCLDLTFGEGGHSEALLEAGAAKVVAVDRDADALERYQKGGKYHGDPRLELIHGCFSDIGSLFSGQEFDGVVMDLGVSTRQLLDERRGFSFSAPGPLDMRMDCSESGTLSSILEEVSPAQLSQTLKENTDINKPDKIARRILDAFQAGELKTTADLAHLFSGKGSRRHPATVIFLALRMMVNEELGEIRKALPEVIKVLRLGGRLVVLTFHSSEDRVVKRIFKRMAGKCICEQPICGCPRQKLVHLVNKKVLQPNRGEMKANPRSRSAKLRCVEKKSITD